jgi:hypothetical protein
MFGSRLRAAERSFVADAAGSDHVDECGRPYGGHTVLDLAQLLSARYAMSRLRVMSVPMVPSTTA